MQLIKFSGSALEDIEVGPDEGQVKDTGTTSVSVLAVRRSNRQPR